MSTAIAQPYLNWLDEDATPPVSLSLRGWQMAASELLYRMRAARNRLISAGASWSDFEDMILAEAKFDSLNAWAELTHQRTARLHRDSYSRTEAKLRARRRNIYKSSARSRAIHVLRGWLRRRNEPLSADQKRLVSDWINYWKDALTGQLRPEAERLELRHFRRTREYTMECRERGLWLTRSQARDLPAGLRKEARTRARELGQPGWFVTADSDLGSDAMDYISDRNVRESLWRQRQQLRESDDTILPMLQLRHQESIDGGHSSFSNLTLWDRTITSPTKVMGMLSEHMEGLRAANRRFTKRLEEEAAKWGIESISPWDRPFLIAQLRKRMRFHEEPNNVFNIERMMEVAVPELVAVGGWSVDHLFVHGEGIRRMWQFNLQRKDGAKCQMWFAPFNPKGDENLSIAATQLFLRSPWNGANPKARAISSIEMNVEHSATCFKHKEMVWLAHEIGHGLHYLSQHADNYGDDNRFPDDIVEFPSQLLERYAQDPQVLARWASHCSAAPALSKRASFWRYHLATHLNTIDEHMRSIFGAWLDLAVHKTNPHTLSFDEFFRKSCERFGISYHEADKSHMRNFMWGAYAATDYSYPLGQALGAELLTFRSDGTLDSGALHNSFSYILENLLADGLDTKSLRKNWMMLKGEKIEDTARRGMKKLTRTMRARVLAASAVC